MIEVRDIDMILVGEERNTSLRVQPDLFIRSVDHIFKVNEDLVVRLDGVVRIDLVLGLFHKVLHLDALFIGAQTLVFGGQVE